MPNFEVLDARITSALNKIIHNSLVKRRISLEEPKVQKQDSFFSDRQIAYLIYEYFRVWCQWFCRELCRPIHYQSTKWVSKVLQQSKGEIVQEPEGEVVRQTKFFQSIQPTPNPVRDRSGRLDDMKNKRIMSFLKRSMLIFWPKNSVLQIKQGDLFEHEIQTRSSEESKNFNVE